MRRLFLRDCQAGDMIEDVFVVSGKQLAMGANGKQYIKVNVSDRSMQFNARMWNATRDIFAAIPESGFLKVRARIENYQQNLQAIIEQTWAAKEGTYEIGDLLPQTSKDIGQMCRKLHEMLDSIQNRHLNAIIQAYRDDENLMTRFCRAPAAMTFHHAFIGGLLEHTLNAIEIADAISRFYPTLNRDLVVAGIFLHDIAKTWELCYDCAFGYTDGGQLVGHIVKSAMWLEQKAKDAEKSLGGEKIPQELIDVLQHIILSHHGELDRGFGSAKSPATPEAMMVHFIDDMDAKLMLALQACRGEAAASADGNWTEYMKVFQGRLYRPDVAPSDAPSAPDDAGGDGEPAAMRLIITNPLFESLGGSKR